MTLLVGLVALAGCQSVDDQTGGAAANQIGAAPAATSSSDYPSLHTVPPRPRLTYSVQQRRAIVDGLIGDRENARYTDQVVRYRTGRSSLPPPPAPPVVAAAEPEPTAEPAATPPDAAPAPAPEPLDAGRIYPNDPDDTTLHGFVDELVRGTEQEPPAAAGSEAESTAPAGGGWFGWLRQLFGQAEPPAPRPASDPPASARPAVALAAPAPAAQPQGRVPAEAEAALTTLMAEASTSVQPAMALAGAGTGDGAAGATTARTALGDRPGSAGREPADDGGSSLQRAAAGETGQPPAAAAAGAPHRPDPGDVGIAIGDGGVAIEVAAPGKVEPAAGSAPAAAQPSAASLAAVGPPAARPTAVEPSRAKPAPARPAAAQRSDTGTLAGRVVFAPGSAALPAGVSPQLERVLAAARAQGARIRIVGEADAEAGALALDRARAVALALVHLGAKPHELEMTLARDATGDQARLLLAAGTTR